MKADAMADLAHEATTPDLQTFDTPLEQVYQHHHRWTMVVENNSFLVPYPHDRLFGIFVFRCL